MSRIYRIDSRDKVGVNDTNTNFSINTISTDIKNIKVKQIVIPNLFNNIRDGTDQNNILNFTSGALSLNVTVPPGFYSLDQLLFYINDQLNGGGGALGLIFTYNETTGLINITNGGADIVLLASSPMAYVLGLMENLTILTMTSSVIPNKPNLFNYSMIYVNSRKLSNGYNMITSEGRQSIIATIPLNTPYGSNIIYEPQNPITISFENIINIDNVDIQIVNHNNEVLYLPANHHIQILMEYDLVSNTG